MTTYNIYDSTGALICVLVTDKPVAEGGAIVVKVPGEAVPAGGGGPGVVQPPV